MYTAEELRVIDQALIDRRNKLELELGHIGTALNRTRSMVSNKEYQFATGSTQSTKGDKQ